MIPLSQICQLKTGKTPPSQEEKYFNGKVNWYTPSDLDKEKHLDKSKRTITELAIKDKKASIFNKGVLLMTCIGEIGKLGITTSLSSSNQQITALIPNKNTCVEFLYYSMKYIKPFLNDIANNSVVPILNNTNLSKIKIPLPLLPSQKKIAAILDKADELRRNDQKILEKYDELAQSVFLEMFGDPVRNEKGWEKVKLKSLGTIKTGNTPSRNIDEYFGNYIEWIKTDNINTPQIYLTRAKESLSEKGLQKGRTVDPGALLVTCIAGSKSVIGNVAIANRKVSFNQQINALQPRTGISIFWYYQFIIAKKYIQSFSTNSMKGMINKNQFGKIEFINPDLELQSNFEEKINNIISQKTLTQNSLQKSEDLFQSLLQRAFKGELV